MSTTFKDKKGRSWDVSLDLYNARLIDASDFSNYCPEKFSILEPDKKLFQRILTSAPFLMAVIWAMVQEQAEAHAAAGLFPTSPKENPEAAELEFVKGINGQAIEDARAAFVEALSDFFPDQRIGLSTLMNSIQTLRQKVQAKVMEVEPLLDQMMEEQVEAGIERLRENLRKTHEERLGQTSTV